MHTKLYVRSCATATQKAGAQHSFKKNGGTTLLLLLIKYNIIHEHSIRNCLRKTVN